MTGIVNVLAIAGTAIVAVAYLPQIIHLVVRHCAYGMSVPAWSLWLLATLLILPRAVASGDQIFLALQIISGSAILFILVFAAFHQAATCPRHRFL